MTAADLRLLLAAALLSALPAGAREFSVGEDIPSAPVATPLSAEQTLHEAQRLALLRGYSDDLTLAPDAAKVAEIREALAAVRRLDPAHAGYTLAHMGPPDDRILVGYNASLLVPLTAAYQGAPAGSDGRRRPTALNLPELDAAAVALGAAFEMNDSYGNLSMSLRFGRAADLRKAATRLSRVPGVSYAQPDRMMGGPGYPVLVDADGAGAWKVTQHRGWGDCISGCINNEYWYYLVRGRTARRAGHYRAVYDARTNSYRETGVKAWDAAPPY